MTAIEIVSALVLAFASFRRPSDREYLIAAFLGLAAAGHAAAARFALGSQGMAASTPFVDRVAWVGFVAALPLCIHFAMAYLRVPAPRWLPPALYAAAVALLALGFRHPMAGAGLPDPWRALASSTLRRTPPVTAFGIATSLAALAAAGSTLALVAKAYLAGRPGALAVVVGATVLVATALNDLAVAGGLFSTGYFGDAGLAAFVVGIATTPSARYAEVARELERRTQELRTRTHELRQSYEELRAAQEELVKKEQLAAVGELAAVIAHEVRNPLAIIANAVAGLRRQVISREDHDVLLTILDEETSRLNRLVTDLLRFARPVNVQRSHIALRDLLERALALASTGAQSIQMQFKMEAYEGRLWGDANLLRQVFDNLIDNAVQAMSSGGALTILVRAVTEDGTDGLAVDIIDTGEGMDTQVRSRALDPFFTTRPSGTGLGLAIVDRIVDAHGGRLAIDSRAGEGTTVTVFLPHGSPSEPPPRSRAAKPATEGYRAARRLS